MDQKGYNPLLDGMLGMAAGDALGVPYEFLPREEMKKNPARDMVGYGTYNQPEGSWSDDTSMALCTADSLIRGFNPDDMMKRFSAWKSKRQYTATGVRFDVGGTCRNAIERYEMGLDAADCGDSSEYGNGNGALMRIFPIALYQCLKASERNKEPLDFLDPVHKTAKLTHAHARGLICCGMYTMMLKEWLEKAPEDTVLDALSLGYEKARDVYVRMGGEFEYEVKREDFFIHPADLAEYPENRIRSSGYVMDTFHAALWCLLKTDDFASCVLAAVNLGEDTDTTAAVAGSLAGVIYGRDAIPSVWLEKLKNKELIIKICDGLNDVLFEKKREKQVIDSFVKEYRHLSQKSSAEILLDQVTYQNVAAAFLAHGVEEEERLQFSVLNAHQAKRLFKQLPVRAGWDYDEQKSAMYRICKAKYDQNPDLKEKLLASGTKEIVYDTTGSHDNEWGRCACKICMEKPAENAYGKILMRVRDEIRRES